MNRINIESKIKVYWKIWRGVNKISEDFDSLNTNLKVFLVGSGNTYWVQHSINKTINAGYDTLEIDIEPNMLDMGSYDLKAIWEKNGARNTLTSVRSGVFSITDNAREARVKEEVINIVSYVESYGRDGMSSYETAVMRGVSEGISSEVEWVRSVSVFNEKVRIANEEQRKTNEAERQSNEEERNKAEIRRERFREGLIDKVNEYKPIVIEGDVTNAPDEEDITSEGGLLKFKNRPAFNDGYGRGYTILREGTPIEAQITKANTIYEIRYDFDLSGKTLTMPEGCILRYNGGAIYGSSSSQLGTIVCDNTIIEGVDDRNNHVEYKGIYEYAVDGRSENRFYDESNPNGMGYMVLRSGPEFSIQNQMLVSGVARSNTIFEIRYDFDLEGNTLYIPYNCVLKFNGGKLFNGTICGSGTKIEAVPTQIFGTDVEITGTWSVAEAYTEWFGAKGDGENDDREAIQKCLDSFVVTRLLAKEYMLKSYKEGHIALELPTMKTLCGVKRQESQGAFLRANLNLDKSIVAENSIVLMVNALCTVEDIGVSGGIESIAHNHSKRVTGITHRGTNAWRIVLRNVDVWSCYYGINMSCWMSRFEYVMCRYCLYGFVLHGILYTTDTFKTGIWDIHTKPNPTYTSVITSCFINNCYCNGCFLGGYYITKLAYSQMTSCGADGCGWFDRKNGDKWAEGVAPPSDLEHVTNENTYPAYRFEECIGVNINGLGAEENAKAIYTRYCKAVNINDCYFGAFNEFYQKDDDAPILFDRIIHSSHDSGVKYENIVVSYRPANEANTFIYATGAELNPTRVEFSNIITRTGYAGIESVESEGHQTGSLIAINSLNDSHPYYMDEETYRDTDEHVYDYTNIGNLREYLDGYYKTHIVLSPRKVVCNLANNEKDIIGMSGSVNGFNDRLIITGQDNLSVSVFEPSSFNNFKSIVFKDIEFVHGAGAVKEYLLAFESCGEVTFDNCKFTRKSALSLDKFFRIQGSSLQFVDCSNPDEVGITSNRPKLTPNEVGKSYYDTSKHIVVYWDGEKWSDDETV